MSELFILRNGKSVVYANGSEDVTNEDVKKACIKNKGAIIMENAKYDVFISYSRKDTAIANKICNALEFQGISYFIDRQGIGGGQEFPEVLAKAIIGSRIMLYIASINSYNSKFTNNEISFAFNEKQKGSILPYIVDGSCLPDTQRFIFSSVNIRTSKEHPIETTLMKDLCKLLGYKYKENTNSGGNDKCGDDEGYVPLYTKDKESSSADFQMHQTICDEKKILYEHYIRANRSIGKRGLMCFAACFSYIPIIAGIVLIWFKPSDFWWFVPTLLSFALLSIALLSMYLHYSVLYRRLQLTKEQEDEFAEQYGREYEEYKELNRKKKLGLLSRGELMRYEEIKKMEKERQRNSNFEGVVSLLFFIVVIVVWIYYW